MIRPLQDRLTTPLQLAFLLRLRQADDGCGPLAGSVEHLLSGARVDFNDVAELQSWLAQAHTRFGGPR